MQPIDWTQKAMLVALIFGLAGASCATLKSTALSERARGLPPRTTDNPVTSPEPGPATQAKIRALYGKLPLQFEANQGQTDAQVYFLSRGANYTLFLTSSEAVLRLRNELPVSPPTQPENSQSTIGNPQSAVLRLQLIEANPKPQIMGLEELPGKVNYFLGNDPTKWRTHIPTYTRVKYQAVYPGIDLVYYGNQGHLEYDFIIAPGADPKVIRLAFQGAEKLQIGVQGDLVLHSKGSEVRLLKPRIYQEIDGRKQLISGRYVLLPFSSGEASGEGGQHVGLQIAAYDASRPLIVDPVLSYSTYLGSSGTEGGFGIAVDPDGNAYVTGSTDSPNFPTTVGSFDGEYGGGTCGNPPTVPCRDVFVTKVDATGGLVYSTYLGGNQLDFGLDVAVDSSGNAYVSGSTGCNTGATCVGNFPIPSAAKSFQRTFGGGPRDAFVVKLNDTGSSLLYSTYLGGGENEAGVAIAVGPGGRPYVVGTIICSNASTCTGGFPIPSTARSFQRTYGGGPRDGFVAKLDPNLDGAASLLYSTYLGGSGEDRALSVDVNDSGDAYVSGFTTSTNFVPQAAVRSFGRTYGGGERDGFVTVLDSDLDGPASLLYSTYLGGSDTERAFDIALDKPSGTVYVAGATSSSLGFPITQGAFQPTHSGGTCGSPPVPCSDAFVTKLDPGQDGDASLLYSTYLGGNGSDSGNAVGVDSASNFYVAGLTTSTNFPTTENALQATRNGGQDAFVTKFNPIGFTVALNYSTYLGGNGEENDTGMAVDSAGNAYVTGTTTSTDFPTNLPTQNPIQTDNAGLADAFVAKILPGEEALRVSPPSLAFGNVTVNTNSPSQTFTVTNSGSSTLTGVATTTAPFSIVSGGSFSLPPGAPPHVVSVGFSPTSTGPFGGLVNIASTGGAASVNLSGSGISPSNQPALSVCSTELDFGSVRVGSSKDLTCTVTNSGSGTLFISAFTAAPFSLVSVPPEVSGGQSGSLILRFTPSTRGSALGSLRLQSNGGNTEITLRGTGTQGAVLTVGATTLTFGGVRQETSKDLALTVQNTGDTRFTGFACIRAPFTLASGGSFVEEVPLDLVDNGGPVELTVRFSPTITGSFQDTLSFRMTPQTCEDLLPSGGGDGDSGTPSASLATVAVSGIGLPASAAGVAYVANRDSDTISVIDTATQVVIVSVRVGDQPVDLVTTPDGSKAYVVNFADNSVSVVDTTALVQTKQLFVGKDPAAAVITPNGKRVYVAHSGIGEDGVSVIDTDTDTISIPNLPARQSPSVLTLNLDGTVLYVLGPGDPIVRLINTTTNRGVSIIAGTNPVAVAFSPDGSRAYIANDSGIPGTVSVFNTTTSPPTKITDVPVGEGPKSLAVTPDGRKVYVTNSRDDTISVINTATNLVDTVFIPPPSQGQAPVRTVSAAAAAVVTTPGWRGPGSILIPPGQGGSSVPKAFVANQTSNNVGVIDIMQDVPMSTVAVGIAPTQIAANPAQSQVIVTNQISNSVSFIDIANPPSVARFVQVGVRPQAIFLVSQLVPPPPPPPPCPPCPWLLVPPGNGSTPSEPETVTFNEELWIFVRGTDNRIYHNRRLRLIGETWTGWSEVPGGGFTATGPGAAVFNNQLYLFVRGTDDKVYQNIFNGASWSGWNEVPGGGLTPSAPAAVAFNNQLYLFVRGTDDKVYQNIFNGASWSGWNEVPGGGVTPSAPAAVVFLSTLYLTVRGNDDRIYDNVLTLAGSWSGWVEVPGAGSTPSGPAAAVFNGQLYYVVRGVNDRIYRNSLPPGPGGSWSGWSEVFGNGLTRSEPGAAETESRLFFVVRGTDDAIYFNDAPTSP